MSNVRIEKTKFGLLFEEAMKKLEKNKNTVAKSGWFEEAKYKNKGKSDIYVSKIAYQNEFGNASKKIPPRPFLRPALINGKELLKNITESESKKILRNESSIEKALFLISSQYVGLVKKEIKSLRNPPLSPNTIKARLRKRKNRRIIGRLDKPLIDSGIMLNTITNILENE